MFSSTIKISTVSDYILPSQECIKPIMKNSKLQINEDEFLLKTKPDLIKSQNNVARVSLQDCLACNGCITTAEAILIESQSFDEFMNKIKQAKNPAIGISQQSRISLAYKFNYSDNQMQQLLFKIFQELNVVLYDLSLYEMIAISNSIKEFNNTKTFPLLCSECPGWVCYAEKTLDESIIQYMSKVKSPQQIFGQINRNIHDYIATIMPCYDKKLEASRIENQMEIDIVLGTKELEEYIEKYISQNQLNFNNQELLKTTILNDQIFNNATSNSYLDYIVQDFVKPNWIVKHGIKKNKDFIEITIYDENNNLKGSFARVYGLKNITNLIFQIKSKNCKYLYVEIMACPMGCLNGGGQIRIPKTTIKPADLVEKLKELQFQEQKQQIQLIESNDYLTTFKHIANETNFQW